MSQEITVKNNLLLKIAERIAEIRSGNSMDDFIFTMFNNSKMKDWHRDNQVRIKSLYDKMHKLRKEHFVFETIEKDGEKIEQVKMTEAQEIPAVPAKYEKKIIQKKGWFTPEKSEQVLVEAEVPAKHIAPTPICLEGKTVEQFNAEYAKLMDQDNKMVF